MLPILAEKLNQANQKRTVSETKELKSLQVRFQEVEMKINNIIDAVSAGLYNPTMKEALTKLEEQKAYISLGYMRSKGMKTLH